LFAVSNVLSVVRSQRNARGGRRGSEDDGREARSEDRLERGDLPDDGADQRDRLSRPRWKGGAPTRRRPRARGPVGYIRLAVDGDGELYIMTKSDGVIRAVVGAAVHWGESPFRAGWACSESDCLLPSQQTTRSSPLAGTLALSTARSTLHFRPAVREVTRR
jgi:hypothetical protein